VLYGLKGGDDNKSKIIWRRSNNLCVEDVML
jgi:hypothetical protein